MANTKKHQIFNSFGINVKLLGHISIYQDLFLNTIYFFTFTRNAMNENKRKNEIKNCLIIELK